MNSVAHLQRISALNLGPVRLSWLFLLASLWCFSIFRTYAYGWLEGVPIQLALTYQYTAVLLLPLVALLWRRLLPARWMLLPAAAFVTFAMAYDLWLIEFSLQSVIDVALHNKLLMGSIIAVVFYALVSSLAGTGMDLAYKLLLLLFAVFASVNAVIVASASLGLLEIIDHQTLNNNRAAFELLALMTAIVGVSLARDKTLRVTMYSYVVVVLLFALLYSARSVLVGVVLVSAGLIYHAVTKKQVLHVALAGALLVSALIPTVYPHENSIRDWAYSRVAAGQAAIAERKRSVDLRRHREMDLDAITRFFDLRNGQNVIEIPEHAISTISRLSHIRYSVDSFLSNPFGRGFFGRDTPRFLDHGNHAAFFVFLESYGIAFLCFVGWILVLRVARLPVIVWIPLAVNMLFMANIVWCCLLPLLDCRRNHGAQA